MGGLAAVVVVVLVGDQNDIEAGANVAATTMATSLSRPPLFSVSSGPVGSKVHEGCR